MKMKKYVERFLAQYEGLTQKNYAIDLNTFEKFITENDLEIESLDRFDIEDFINHLKVNGGKSGTGESPNTINRRLASLNSFMNYLVSHRIILDNVARGVKRVKPERKIVETLSVEEMNKLLEASYRASTESLRDNLDFLNTRNNLIMSFLRYGLRNAELRGIRDEDIDVVNRRIKIMGKGSKERFISITEKEIEMYGIYTEIKNAKITNIKSDTVFVSHNGSKLDNWDICRILKECLRKANISEDKIEKITPHTLRHTAATIMMKNDIPIPVISRALGHSSTAVTQQVYLHADDTDTSKAFGMLDNLYN